MARKNQLADKLAEGEAGTRPGWRDTITPGQPEPTESKSTGRFKRKTYLLTPNIIQSIKELAEREQVGINELVRYMLIYVIEEVESGELPIPTAPGKRQIAQ